MANNGIVTGPGPIPDPDPPSPHVVLDSNILDDIRKLMGPDTVSIFDQDLLIHINTFVADLTQVGVGPAAGIFVDENTTWNQLITNPMLLTQVRTYVYLKTRLVFDPPSSGFTTTALKEAADEILWRINVDAETEEV